MKKQYTRSTDRCWRPDSAGPVHSTLVVNSSSSDSEVMDRGPGAGPHMTLNALAWRSGVIRIKLYKIVCVFRIGLGTEQVFNDDNDLVQSIHIISGEKR